MQKKMTRGNIKNIIAYAFLAICFLVIGLFCPVLEEGENYKVWTLIPPAAIFVFIVLTSRIVEGFVLTAILTVFIKYRSGFVGGFVESIIANVTDPDGFGVLFLFMLGGMVTVLFKISGAGTYFARWIAKKAKSSKIALFMASLLCIPLAVDDYTSTLVVGNCITPLTDEFNVPREMTAYVLRASSANLSTLLPIGAWAIYIGTVIDMWDLDIVGNQTGLMYFFTKCLPFCFFPIVCLLMCWLIIGGAIKPFGKMKEAYRRVEQGGSVVPEAKPRYIDGVLQEPPAPEPAPEPRAKVNLTHFIVPVVAILAFGYAFEWDMKYGLTWGLITSFVYYIITGVFAPIDAADVITEGLSSMSVMCTMCTCGLVICNGLADLGFVEYVVDVVSQLVSPTFLPLIIFIGFSLTEMLVTFNYTLYLIAMPIVVGVAVNVGANVPLAIAALISAGLWGYQTAFSSDGGMLACAACGGIDLMDQTFSQYKITIVCWIISAVLFAAFGIIL